jgi:2-keto-4-pentenoate hydratase/2-oxohepta-3-ene-1,7-dioic acid hydratase in catechol pathway
MAADPPQFLKPGDIVDLGVEGLGQQRHGVVAYSGQA